ncbi:hypothetical protein TeGR_g12081, partial [Tetraparma gracilis]
RADPPPPARRYSTLYMQAPPALEQQLRPNLDKPLKDLIESGDEITVTDPVFPGSKSLALKVVFEDAMAE